MHFGQQNGVVFQIDKDKPIDNVSTGKGDAFTYPTAKDRQTLATWRIKHQTRQPWLLLLRRNRAISLIWQPG
ncbi:hypothetical protein GCK32_020214, partial [Trichostrongylus colubriformis]